MVLMLFILGLFTGSFLNVLIDRIPKGQGWIRGRSKCDYCRHTLGFLDLLPVVSFLFLKGHCRYCGRKLAVFYPLSELMTGVLFVSVFYILNWKTAGNIRTFDLVYYEFIFCALAVIAIIDSRHHIIPDQILFPAVAATILHTFLNFHPLIFPFLLSAFFSSFFFLFLFLATKGKGMGFGDVKYAFFMGFFLGYPLIVIGLYTAFLTGAFVSLILLLTGKKKMGSRIAFGPFLILGTVISYIFGNAIFNLLGKYFVI